MHNNNMYMYMHMYMSMYMYALVCAFAKFLDVYTRLRDTFETKNSMVYAVVPNCSGAKRYLIVRSAPEQLRVLEYSRYRKPSTLTETVHALFKFTLCSSPRLIQVHARIMFTLVSSPHS